MDVYLHCSGEIVNVRCEFVLGMECDEEEHADESDTVKARKLVIIATLAPVIVDCCFRR